jgi:hydroxypyruvate isomerase
MTGYIRGDFGAGADELIRTAQESIAVAQTLDCPRLNLHGTGLDGKGLPVVPGEDMPGPLWISAARTLTRLGDMAERAGVTFCLENLNTAVDHPGVPFARAADTLALVEAVGHPRVRLMLDLYHAQIGEGNLIELVRRAGPLIGEIQVADVPGRRDQLPRRGRRAERDGLHRHRRPGGLGRRRRQRPRPGPLPGRLHGLDGRVTGS